MLELEYFVVAASVSIDQWTNRVSIFNVIDEVRTELPRQLTPVLAIASWNAEEDDTGNDYQVAVRTQGPGIDIEPIRLNIRSDGRRSRTIMQVQGIRIEEPGRIVFELPLNNKHKATHTVDVFSVDTTDRPELKG